MTKEKVLELPGLDHWTITFTEGSADGVIRFSKDPINTVDVSIDAKPSYIAWVMKQIIETPEMPRDTEMERLIDRRIAAIDWEVLIRDQSFSSQQSNNSMETMLFEIHTMVKGLVNKHGV